MNYFIKLNDIRMSNELENMDLSSHSFNITHILDLIFFKYFYSNLQKEIFIL